ncbi:DUF2945 domain-containing protein [Yoonia litorea]|uniref:Hypervirulence associated protein TUDOR domain-containing protein n=1 Tax=Yoonia litorea TaxID=1123755 RepID=A0A1I6N037_9RHOB|nr:DUF2945 domain-containing protein [Yoonia litorea]SFS21325.1 Protein of unknown function [Yoonia litorea]
MAYQTGEIVEWDWGNGTAQGKIQERHKESITRTIDGSEVTRNGSDDDPALEIEQDDGTKVLKLASEVRSA